MICAQPITHTIKAGDSLWLIAQAHGTTVEEIMTMNPGIDPYNLRIGTRIYVCENTVRPEESMNGPVDQPQTSPAEDLPPTQIAPLPAQNEFPEADGGEWTQPVPEQYVPENMTSGYPQWAAGMMGSSGMTGNPGNTGSTAAAGCFGAEKGGAVSQSLNGYMRRAWSQHLYWVRMLMVSILGHLDDQSAVMSRALETPADITAVFAVYYPVSDTGRIGQLLTKHVQDGASLVTALRDGDRKRAEEINRNMYADGGRLAEALGDMNPYYNRKALKDMLARHMDLCNRQTVNRIAGNYAQDVRDFDRGEKEMIGLADYLTEGISQQYYN